MSKADRTARILGTVIQNAVAGIASFPLCGKVPAIANPHPQGGLERRDCKGECGLDGHGLWDATTDLEKLVQWFGSQYPGYNYGIAIPPGLMVLDTDPRKPGHWPAWWALTDRYGRLPSTYTNLSGRLDGGLHMWFIRPPGRLDAKRLGVPGVDLKTWGGYVVGPGSIHPDTGREYLNAVNAPYAHPPAWLTELLTVPETAPPESRTPNASRAFLSGAPRLAGVGPSDSIADRFCEQTTWADILEPHGWHCIDGGSGDSDGDRWLHPAATSPCSATVRNGCLFVYSTSTEFDTTSAGDANGYTKFRAHAVLNHHGDLSEAARTIRKSGV